MRVITAATLPCRAGSGYGPVPIGPRPGRPDLAAAAATKDTPPSSAASPSPASREHSKEGRTQ